MKANFNVETSLGSGTNGALNGNTTATGTTRAPAGWINTASIGNRAMWAGISTSGGLEVRGGLQNQFIRDVALSSAADGTTNVVGNLLAGNSSVFADRHNAISVVQTMGAVKVGAAMTGRSTEKDAVANVDTGKGYELMANYSAGKLALGAAYRKVDNTAVAITKEDQATDFNKANGTTYTAASFTDIAASGTETETTVISASYNFGPVKAFVGYGTQDILNTVTATVGQKSEREVTTIGVNGNVNAKTQLFATYSTGETKVARAAGVAPALDMDGYVVGARYSLSKRTTAYAIYGESDVDASGATTATTSGAKLTGTKTKQMALGINHAF
jgi:predicted porin